MSAKSPGFEVSPTTQSGCSKCQCDGYFYANSFWSQIFKVAELCRRRIWSTGCISVLSGSISISHSQSSVGVGPETELSNYGAELCCSTTVTNCTATNFWKAREPSYPLLTKVALDLLSAPASQAYTERLFSVCGDLTAGKRNRMTTALERRVFLKVNSKYMWTDLLAFRLPIVDCQAIASTARVKRSVVMWLISDY